jgi:ATP-dependent RNA helicase RhlE
MQFEEFNLKKTIKTALELWKYSSATTIQAAAFSPIMSGKDVIGLAQTGTGKTIAYCLPLLNMWQFSKDPHPQILILVPTRELVAQVVREIQKLTEKMNVHTVGVFGGANINTQASDILQGLDVLVGTPGRVLDLAANGSLQLKHVKKVVVDEFDETLSEGFRPQLLRIFEYLPEKRQNLLFSATMSEEVQKFVDAYFDSPIRIEAARVGTPVERIKQRVFEAPNVTTKIALLEHLIKTDESFQKVLIFVSSRAFADYMFAQMEEVHGENVRVIHSNKAQNYRFNAVNDFEVGKFKYLIATDLIARGIDVTDVSHVINFDLPDEFENYLHRIGRTGRQDKNGEAISFVAPRDKVYFSSFQELLPEPLTIESFPTEVEYSDSILAFEKEEVKMKNTLVKLPRKEDVGPAFHEKKDKNKKVNVRYNHKKAMQEKYGKSKKKGSKKK